jgi:L-aspartate oxidase
VVLGRTCAERILKDGPATLPLLPDWDESKVEDADEQVVISHNWDELRLLMWNYVGIVRTTKRLERALHRIKLLRGEIDEYYANFRVNRDLLELRNLVDCAELIVRSALMRHESRGLHYSRDFPNTLPVSFPTVLVRRARSGKAAKVRGLSG